MRDRCLCPLGRAGVDAELYLVLQAAGGKLLDLVLRLCDAEYLCLVCRRVTVLAARQMEERIEEQGETDADGKEARKALRVDFHGAVLSCEWKVVAIIIHSNDDIWMKKCILCLCVKNDNNDNVKLHISTGGAFAEKSSD